MKRKEIIATDSGPSQFHYRTTITQFAITESVKTVDGGYVFLLNWYCERGLLLM